METAATPDVGAPAVEGAPAPDSAAQEAAKKWKVKVNNQEMEVDEKELVTGYQTRKAADERFRQASELHKSSESLQREYAEMAKNPAAFFKKNGLDPEKWAEDLLMQKLKLERMSPEQREALEIKAENARLKQEKEDRDKKLEEEELKGVTSREVQALDTELATALQGANLKTIKPAFIRAVADKMIAYHDKTGGERMSAAKAVELVKAEGLEGITALADELPVEELMRLLSGKSDAIRKYFIDKVVENGPMRKPQVKSDARPAPKEKATMRTDDFFAKLDKKFSK